MPEVCLVAGARPNFMKVAPIIRAIRADRRLTYSLIHTGQHYDYEMNDVFFEELDIPAPNVTMECGGGSHARQTAKIMVGFEEICNADRPDCVLVVGDVNSTVACALVAKKLGIPVAHVEAGLRSGDLSMPEEINRLATDSITDLFFVTEPEGVANLRREGKREGAIHFVGHVMVDNLLHQVAKLRDIDVRNFETSSFKSSHNEYGVVTLHRASNVDDPLTLGRIADTLNRVSHRLPLIFPVHPRTRASLSRLGINFAERVEVVSPQPYMAFLNLWKDARIVLTDSGGLQEETTALGVPCVTLRENTERPITIDEGTNVLAGTTPERILRAVDEVLAGRAKVGRQPKFWDGRAAERIVEVLAEAL